ncbi:DUF7689 domain-containing protein [Argonema antarcticum]|uniref:DUF7689 domain-containing protein n=1 Tax=Argonema antarcticum TaxID=2942763 RepID=UPI0020127FE9|nr:hypothetical protein [Argonema antarcticum]MCL1472282.1 hypothetical protein [Argonema antarcticum A004/B2]
MVENNPWIQNIKEWIEQNHPNLVTTGYQITSSDTTDYNCIAWAAGSTEEWWWPDAKSGDYWPPNILREESLTAFMMAYQTLGYEVCDNTFLEVGFEKIAIYVLDGKPQHAARQLPNGKWTSKLGQYEDIEHNSLEGLEGSIYGEVACVMKRRFIEQE